MYCTCTFFPYFNVFALQNGRYKIRIHLVADWFDSVLQSVHLRILLEKQNECKISFQKVKVKVVFKKLGSHFSAP